MKNPKFVLPVWVEVILAYSKYIILAWLILFVGLLIFPSVGSQVFMEVSGRMDPSVVPLLILAGPTAAGLVWFIALIIVIIWPFIAFIVWAVRDSRKFFADAKT